MSTNETTEQVQPEKKATEGPHVNGGLNPNLDGERLTGSIMKAVMDASTLHGSTTEGVLCRATSKAPVGLLPTGAFSMCGEISPVLKRR